MIPFKGDELIAKLAATQLKAISEERYILTDVFKKELFINYPDHSEILKDGEWIRVDKDKENGLYRIQSTNSGFKLLFEVTTKEHKQK